MFDLLHQTREEYGAMSLLESEVDPDPIEQFKRWFAEYAQLEPKTSNAMLLSTVDEQNHPDSRVVLLKELTRGEFIFYSHYTSAKGKQMDGNPWVALNFYWSQNMRQIRVRGKIHRLSAKHSDEYFYSRPIESQLGAIASEQSQIIPNQKALLDEYQRVCTEYEHKKITRPASWGGYAVVPEQIEFWQGRNNRLHDRILYTRKETQWKMDRLAP